jgi:hypothetical protein
MNEIFILKTEELFFDDAVFDGTVPSAVHSETVPSITVKGFT